MSQTYQVVMGFKTLKGHNVLPGMNAKVFPLASAEGGESAIHIPIDSVVPSNTGQQFVWVVTESGEVRKQCIQVGPLVGDKVTVLSGLNAGDVIAVAGVQALSEGQRVRSLNDNGER